LKLLANLQFAQRNPVLAIHGPDGMDACPDKFSRGGSVDDFVEAADVPDGDFGQFERIMSDEPAGDDPTPPPRL
jgi:hypothetical protein